MPRLDTYIVNTGTYYNQKQREVDMAATNLLERITIDPDICHGKPCIRGLRYPVEVLLELLSAGMTIDDILVD